MCEAHLRTTLTLEDEVARRLREECELRECSLKDAVNQALRVVLGISKAPRRKRYRVRPHASAFRAGVDTRRLNQLVDELEAEEFGQGR